MQEGLQGGSAGTRWYTEWLTEGRLVFGAGVYPRLLSLRGRIVLRVLKGGWHWRFPGRLGFTICLRCIQGWCVQLRWKHVYKLDTRQSELDGRFLRVKNTRRRRPVLHFRETSWTSLSAFIWMCDSGNSKPNRSRSTPLPPSKDPHRVDGTCTSRATKCRAVFRLEQLLAQQVPFMETSNSCKRWAARGNCTSPSCFCLTVFIVSFPCHDVCFMQSVSCGEVFLSLASVCRGLGKVLHKIC